MGLLRIGVVVVTLCVAARPASSAPDSGAEAVAETAPADHRWLSAGGLAGVSTTPTTGSPAGTAPRARTPAGS